MANRQTMQQLIFVVLLAYAHDCTCGTNAIRCNGFKVRAPGTTTQAQPPAEAVSFGYTVKLR